MQNINQYEKAVLILLDKYKKSGLSERMLWNTIYRDYKHPKELILKAFESLQEKNLIYKLGNRSWFRITTDYYENFAEEMQSVVKKKVLPSIDFPDKVYQDVIESMSIYGKDLEQKPRIYKAQDEESLRDHFLTSLTGRYEKTTATGETFNAKGKTDIVLKDHKGNNLFIAECKWWKGSLIFHSTIGQLFDRYLSWRDTKVALLFFVSNKDFSNVLNQIKDEAEKHPYFLKYLKTTNKTNFSFVFRQKDDTKNEVKVEIMFFHFPEQETEKNQKRPSA